MSLPSVRLQPVPRATARVARQAFPHGNAYLFMRDELGSLYRDADFRDLFPRDGQPALAPWRLALVCVMQFAEGLSDRQAAEAVRARIDWKYALALELDDPGFNYSVLSEFRDRLLAGGAEQRLLEVMLTRFAQQAGGESALLGVELRGTAEAPGPRPGPCRCARRSTRARTRRRRRRRWRLQNLGVLRSNLTQTGPLARVNATQMSPGRRTVTMSEAAFGNVECT